MKKCNNCHTIVDYSEFNNLHNLCNDCVSKALTVAEEKLDGWKYEGLQLKTENITLKDKLAKTIIDNKNIQVYMDKVSELSDKLHRRNMQITELKKQKCPWNIVKDCKRTA